VPSGVVGVFRLLTLNHDKWLRRVAAAEHDLSIVVGPLARENLGSLPAVLAQQALLDRVRWLQVGIIKHLKLWFLVFNAITEPWPILLPTRQTLGERPLTFSMQAAIGATRFQWTSPSIGTHSNNVRLLLAKDESLSRRSLQKWFSQVGELRESLRKSVHLTSTQAVHKFPNRIRDLAITGSQQLANERKNRSAMSALRPAPYSMFRFRCALKPDDCKNKRFQRWTKCRLHSFERRNEASLLINRGQTTRE